MLRENLSLIIGGAAGQGLVTVGEILARALAKSHHNFITWQGYQSRIRGGHNSYCLKLAPRALLGPEEKDFDLLLCLDGASEKLEAPRLKPGGLLITLDHDLSLALVEQNQADYQRLAVPYGELAPPREQNLVALGVLTAAIDIPYDLMAILVDLAFKGNSQAPLLALQKGFDWAAPQIGGRFRLKVPTPAGLRLLTSGNEALAMGAVAGGINFCSFYPMTPGSSVALSMADWAADLGLIVEQAEDEIAAVNMAIGASYAGAPALVPTSGGGFSLMEEGVSLAAMTETPLVIVVASRPGPATGLPTRTEQADLNLVLYSGHGEFPRVILAPSTLEECFYLAVKAVNLAEESQGPVFILTDQFLADSTRAVKPFDFGALPPAVNPAEIHQRNEAKIAGIYQRYFLNPDGRSLRLLPGLSPHLVKADSDEHDTFGCISEDLNLRQKMQDKRMKKMNWLKEQALAPYYEGVDGPELLLISWGSSKGACLDALSELLAANEKAGLLHFSQLYPLYPQHFLPLMQSAKKTVCIESNYQGQFALLLKQETGFSVQQNILRYDGLPLCGTYILERLKG